MKVKSRTFHVNVVAFEKQYVLYISVCARTGGCVRVLHVRARVALLTQHPKLMRRIILSSATTGCTIFFDIISQTARFSEKRC